MTDSFLPQELAEAIAAVAGREVTIDTACLSPIAMEILRDEEEARYIPREAGQLMPDGTIYLGVYQWKNCRDGSLSKVFNVFAAPEDLPELLKYVDAVEYIAGLQDWHGYNGTRYAIDAEFYTALDNNSYSGGWIIPTRDILTGVDKNDKASMSDNLFKHRENGVLKGM